MLYKHTKTINSIEFELTDWFAAKITKTNERIWVKMRRPKSQLSEPIGFYIGFVGSTSFGCISQSSAIEKLKSTRLHPNHSLLFANNQEAISNKFEVYYGKNAI